MSKKMTPHQIQERLNMDARNIILDQSTYVNTKVKARFIDPEFGEWWATPNSVLMGSNHPANRLVKIKEKLQLTSQQIQERLDKDGRGIILDQSTYVNTATKARFIDPEFGEWWAVVNNVIRGSCHPKRARINTVNTIKHSEQKINELLQSKGLSFIKIDYSTYKGAHKPARFIDVEFGEFWAKLSKILYRGAVHPERRKAIRIKNKQQKNATSVDSKNDDEIKRQRAQKRLMERAIKCAQRVQQKHPGWTLVLETFVKYAAPAKFVSQNGDEIWIKPAAFLQRKNPIPQKYHIKPHVINERLIQQKRDFIHMDVETYVNTITKARFIDSEFGEWWSTPNQVLTGRNHPKRFFKQNQLEKFVAEQLGAEWIGDVKLEGLKYKPDFKLSDSIYLNIDGLYWHTEQYKGKMYHFNIRQWFEERGMRILQFRENEIRDKWDIIKGIVDAVMDKSENKIGARECDLVDLSPTECYEFYEKWHLKGGIKLSGYGLKYNGELIATLSVRQYGNTLKIERFCVKPGWVVSGGYSKLLNRALKDYSTNVLKIQSWVDLRYGNGHSLEKMGFVKVKDTLGWEWTDLKTTYNRLQCRANMDERKLKEKEYAAELGWFKIYDAGQRLFEKDLHITGMIE